jgi:hypothetical protein
MATQAFWCYEQSSELTQSPTYRRESRDYPLRPVSAAPARATWRAFFLCGAAPDAGNPSSV